MHPDSLPWRLAGRLARGLAAPALLSLAGAAAAGDLPPPLPVAAPAAAPVVIPDVRSARQMALEHQPSVLAARASLSAAVTRKEAVDHLRGGCLIARDLPVRRQQAALGVQSAEAALHQAEADAVYAVTWSYLAVQYAREQEAVADGARGRLNDLATLVKDTLKAEGRRDVYPEHLQAVNALLNVVDARREEAVVGRVRAEAALREALGLGPDCTLVVPARPLPRVTAPLTREAVVAAALQRRGEIGQASAFVDTTLLEVEAQRAILLPSGRTFAAGTDLHAKGTPEPGRGFDYSPGALGPEMPTTLAGSRGERADQAFAYHQRAGAVLDKTRNLIALEADNAFLRWQERGTQMEKLAKALPDAEAYQRQLQLKFDREKTSYPTVENLIGAGSAYTRLLFEAREVQFQYLISLAMLERITGGAVCIDFDAAPPAPAGK